MRYVVENYAAPSCTVEREPVEFRSLKRAREEARKRLGVAVLRPERKWKPTKVAGAIEAYRAQLGKGPSGGVMVFRERGGPAPKRAKRVDPKQLDLPAPVDDRKVLELIAALGGTGRVRLADLKRELGSPPQAEFRETLLRLQDEERVILMRLDNPPEIKEADRAAAILIAGNPRHLVFLQ